MNLRLFSCLEDGMTKVITTNHFTRKHVNSACQRFQTSVKHVIACDKLPADELLPARDYTIRRLDNNSTRSVLHVYPCGTGRTACMRRVVKVSVARSEDGGCQCRVKREESQEACCCNPQEGGVANRPTRTSRKECESGDSAVAVSQQKTWKLIDGKCWPLTFTTTKPLGRPNFE